jgi:SOS response regulatory protein OraA/RecX
MSKRLQVILDEEEMSAIQEIAKQHRTTVAEWVRQALRAARRQEPRMETEKKLKAIRAAVRHQFPAGDIQQMLAEIESGYLQDDHL